MKSGREPPVVSKGCKSQAAGVGVWEAVAASV